jgi:hypothetical protein
MVLSFVQSAIACTDGLHVQFGTRANANSGHGDGGMLLSESSQGTLLVAGYAEGARSDTGGLRPKPMIAAFDPKGRLLYQRVYDRVGWQVIGINAGPVSARALLWKRAPYRHELARRAGDEKPEPGRVELWTLTRSGELDDLLLEIEHETQQLLTNVNDREITFWLSPRTYSGTQFGNLLTVRSFGWDGREIRDPKTLETQAAQSLYADADVILSVRQEGDYKTLSQTLVVTSREGETRSSEKVPGCGHCRLLDARRDGDDFEILAAPDIWRTNWRGIRLLKYRPGQGTVEVVAEWPALHGASVRFNDGLNGELLLTGSDAKAPVIASVTADRKLRWVRRFVSGNSHASLASAIVLSDRRIATTGLTARHLSLDSEADSDAMLIVTDPDGQYLERFGDCIVHDGALASAIYEMGQQYAVAVPLYGFQYSERHSTQNPALPARVEPLPTCRTRVEQRLLRFLTTILAHPDAQELDQVPAAASLTLEAHQHPGPDGRAFRYYPGYSSAGLVPMLVADIEQPTVVAAELVEHAVPFIEQITSAHGWLQEETGFYFQNGEPSGWASISYPSGPDVLSPKAIAAVADDLETSFVALKPSEKRSVKTYAAGFTRVVIHNGGASIRRHGHRRIELPAQSADRFWRWILDDISVHAPRIAELEGRLQSRIGISITEKPRKTPEQYRQFLEELAAAFEGVPDMDLRIRLEYYVEPNNSHMLAIWRDDRRIANAVADVSAETLAEWILRVPRPK